MARVLAPCGTPAAYQRHRRHYQPDCPRCRAAKRDESAAARAAVARIRKGARP